MPKPKVNLNIDETPSDNYKKKYRKWRYSNFFVTVNPNLIYESPKEAEPTKKILLESIHDLLRNIQDYIKIKEPEASFTDEWFDKIDLDAVIEMNSSVDSNGRNMLHAHIMVKVRHRTLILLDLDKIKAKVKDDLQLPYNPYINYKFVRNASDTLENYIQKTL